MDDTNNQPEKTIENLQESEATYRGLFESLDEAVQICKLIFDENGQPIDVLMLDVNPAYEKHSGLKKGEVVGKHIKSVLYIVEQVWLDRYAVVVREGKSMHFEEYNASLDRWFDVRANPLGDNRFAAIFTDITEHKKAEKAIEDSKNEFKAILDNSIDALYRRNLMTDNYEYYSPAIVQITGYSMEEILSMSQDDVLEYVHPDDLSMVKSEKIDISSNFTQNTVNYRFLCKDKKYKWLSDRFRIIYNEKGEPIFREGIIRDISEQKKSEEIEERLNVLMDNNPSLIFMKDENGKYVYLNKAYKDNFVPSEDWYEKTDFDFWPKESAELFRANDSEVLKSGKIHQFMEDSTDMGGKRHVWLNYKFPFTDSKGRKYLGGIGIDATNFVHAEEALKESEEKYKHIINFAPTGIYEINYKGPSFTSVNDAMCQISGYSREELMTMNPLDLLSNKSKIIFQQRIQKGLKGEKIDEDVDFKIITKNGREIWTNLHVKPSYKDGTLDGALVVAHDITERKKVEEKLRNSEKRYRTLYETMLQGVVYQNADGHITSMNPAAEKIMGYSFDEIKYRTSSDHIWHAIHEDGTDFPGEEHPSMIALKTGKEIKNVVMGVKYPSREGYTWLEIDAIPEFRPGEQKPYQVYTTFEDITERKNAEKELKESEKHYRELFNNPLTGFAVHEIVTDEDGNPVDYIFLEVNKAFGEQTGLNVDDIIGKRVTEVLPGIEETDYIEKYGQVALKGKSISFEQYTPQLGKYYQIAAFSPQIGQFATFFTDITNRKKAAEELKKAHDDLEEKVEERTAQLEEMNVSLKENELKLKDAIGELELSNRELQSFAYITSHDLQEPLRSIASFAQLLQRRYKGKLDDDADDFIEFMVDGATRMKDQIQDLLEYSRIDRTGEEFTETDMNEMVEKAKSSLHSIIDESNADITNDYLPVVHAGPNQMERVLLNLIGNAIKFKKPQFPPRIHISAKKENNEYIFSVEDNGIGMDPKYSDKIFEVFKRLHTRDKYSGTGIGLSIVKKIIESNGGRIWFESELGVGSTFYFTIPVSSDNIVKDWECCT